MLKLQKIKNQFLNWHFKSRDIHKPIIINYINNNILQAKEDAKSSFREGNILDSLDNLNKTFIIINIIILTLLILLTLEHGLYWRIISLFTIYILSNLLILTWEKSKFIISGVLIFLGDYITEIYRGLILSLLLSGDYKNIGYVITKYRIAKKVDNIIDKISYYMVIIIGYGHGIIISLFGLLMAVIVMGIVEGADKEVIIGNLFYLIILFGIIVIPASLYYIYMNIKKKKIIKKYNVGITDLFQNEEQVEQYYKELNEKKLLDKNIEQEELLGSGDDKNEYQ